jgi:hypothetical protein
MKKLPEEKRTVAEEKILVKEFIQGLVLGLLIGVLITYVLLS